MDEVIDEPKGGSQADVGAAFALVNAALERNFAEIRGLPVEELLERRYEKFRTMARFYTVA